MFIISLNYIKAIGEIEAHIDAHNDFLNKYYADRKFLMSGRKNPRTGGIIIAQIAALQSEYSLLTRDVEESILPVVRELGISLVPYSPLARGLFNNINEVQQLEESDFRKSLPRYQEAYLENNKSLAKELNELAASKGITGSQLALAWVLAQGDDIIPIPGTKRVKYLEQNIEAVSVTFTETEKNQIEEIIKKYPNTGPRYSEGSMKLVNN
ncbi:aldo/keto reductase [Elizabethkingia anophelis]|uniref:aldo/keto reductase n=1 Tax=Elizabethkingia anophelis TaxID=1117645 RepID=UPI0038919B60